MNPVFSALTPVVLLIALGFVAGRRRWVGPGAVKDLSNLVFLLLTPALLFAQTGLHIPAIIDRPLELLRNAFTPMALILVGVTLATTALSSHWRGALALSAVKNLLHPLLVVAAGWPARPCSDAPPGGQGASRSRTHSLPSSR